MLKLKAPKKLSIKAESLRRLTESELGGVAGGRPNSYWCSTAEQTKCGNSAVQLGICN